MHSVQCLIGIKTGSVTAGMQVSDSGPADAPHMTLAATAADINENFIIIPPLINTSSLSIEEH